MSPRVELLPMIDVIFLLLTFFVYSMALQVNTHVLPVKLAPVSGEAPAKPGDFHAVTIDAQGKFYLDMVVVETAELREKLKELAAKPEPPTVFLAVQSAGEVDRGPMLMQLVEMVQSAGITNMAFVGPPPGSADDAGKAAAPARLPQPQGN